MKSHLASLLVLFWTAVGVSAQVPVLQLLDADCGILDYHTNDIIKSTQPQNTSGILYYQWRFEELEAPFQTYEVIAPSNANPNFRLEWFEEIEYGRTYDVSVRIAMNPGAMVGNYGPECTIGLQEDVLTTALETQYASTFVGFCDVIGAESVGAADRYRWTFNDLSVVLQVYGDNDERLLRMSKIPNLRLGRTYIVSVFAEVNGEESPAGTLRFLNTNNFVPNTGLRTDIYPCGGTYPINTQVQAVEVCKAQNYTWRFRNISQTQPDLIYTRLGSNRFIRLEWVTGLIVGDTYNVDVKARQGQVNGDYSSVCAITIGESSAPELLARISDDAFATAPNVMLPATSEPLELKLAQPGSGTGLVTVSLTGTYEDTGTLLELYDLNGKLLAERRLPVGTLVEQYNWNLPGMPPGIYVVRATTGGAVATAKVSFF